MKRLLLLFLFIVLPSFSFAQGFGRTYWDMDVETLEKRVMISRIQAKENKVTGVEYIASIRILGEVTTVSYFFKDEQLKAIGYNISYSKEKQIELESNLIKKFGKPKVSISKAPLKPNSETMIEILGAFEKSNMSKPCSIYDDIIAYNSGGKALIGFWLENKKTIEETNTDGGLQIYSSIFSTIYVLYNFFPDTIVVLYTEKVDDF